MKETSHMLAGVATGILISEKFNINPMFSIGLSVIGSVIVDIDTKKSFVNKLLFPVKAQHRNILKTFISIILMLVPNNFVKYLGGILLLSVFSSKVEYRITLFGGVQKREYHRTLFHDPFIGCTIFIIPLLILKIPYTYIIPYLSGLLFGHYLMDSFTRYGLPSYVIRRRKPIRMPLHYNSKNKLAELIIVTIYITFTISIAYYEKINILIEGI